MHLPIKSDDLLCGQGAECERLEFLFARGFRRLKPSAKFGIQTVILLVLVAMSLVATAPANAAEEPEEWCVSTWHTKEGLPQNTVTALTQTRDGYLWVGTGGGLARFDGVRFRTFGLEDGLGSVRITALLEDRGGILWVGTRGGGVSRWEDGRLTRLSEGGEFSGADVESLAAGQDGTLYIGTRRGLLRWRDGQFTRMGAQVGLPEGVVRALLSDSAGTLWVSVYRAGLFRGANGRFTPEPQNERTPSDAIYSLAEDQDGSIWVGGNSAQVWQWRDSVWKLYSKTNGVPIGYFPSLVRGSHPGEVWVGSRNQGLAYFANGSFHPPVVSSDLLEQPISALWVDRDGTVWVGAGGGGLSRLSRRKLHYWGKSEGLPDSKVSSVAEDADGILWVATETVGPWQFAGGRFTKLADPIVSPNFPYYYSALRTGDGSVWMAGEGLLNRFHKGQDSEWHMIDELWRSTPNALCEDGTNVWVGTVNSALFKCDGTNLQMVAPDGTFGGRIASLVREAPETLWIGCVGGLYRWDQGHVRRWSTQDGLLCADIQALHRDPDGVLWIGTLGGGLARLKNGRIANITKRQGLIDDIIVQILPDDLGHLWLGCSHGIMRLERNELDDCADGRIGYVHVAVVGQDDGMLSEQCMGDHSPTAVKTKDGRLIFPTTRGLVEIDPRRWEQSTIQMPQANIEEILVDGRSQHGPGATVLAPGVRRLELSYTAPSLQGAEQVRFRYRLRPLDEDWISAGTRRRVSYGNPAPGKYTFEVTACDNNGEWGANSASLAFTVLPHYWQTVWFRIGMGLVLVCLGAAGVGWWSRSRVRRAGERERAAGQIRELAGRLIDAQEQERARLARELHDDITQRLARLAIDVGRCELGTSQATPAETARGVREGLVELSEDVHALSYRLHPSILEDLGLAAALRAESEHFTRLESVPVDVKLGEIPENIPREPALCVFRVAQEALRNSARHARARVVELSLRALDDGLQLAVRDDGCGFDPAGPRARTSLGLVSMRERVHSLGGELDIESAPGRGTTILAWVPLKGRRA